MKKRLQSIAKWIWRQGPRLGLVVLLLLFVAWGSLVFFFNDIAHYYAKQVSLKSGLNLGFKKAHLGLDRIEFDGLELKDSNGSTLLQIQKVTGAYKLGSLANGQSWSGLGDLTGKGAQAFITVDELGKLNWAKLDLKSSSGQSPGFWSKYRGLVKVEDVRIVYEDKRKQGFRQEVNQATVIATIRPLQPVRLKAEGVAPTEGSPGTVKLDGQFDPLSPSIEARIEYSELSASNIAKHPLIPLLLDITKGKISGTVWIDGRQKKWGDLWKLLTYRLDLKLAEVTAGPNPSTSASLAKFIPDMAVPTKKGPAVKPELKASALHELLQFENVSGQVRFGSGMFYIQELVGSVLGGQAHLAGAVSSSAHTANDRLAFRLDQVDLSRWKLQGAPKLTGKLSVDGLLNGPLAQPEVIADVRSAKVTAQGRSFQNLRTSLHWVAHSLKIDRFLASYQGGKVELDGWIFASSDPQFALHLKTQDANLKDFIPSLSGNVLANGDFTLLGSLKNPVVSGDAQINGLSHLGLPTESAQSRVIADRSGAILFDVQGDGALSNIKVPWATYDFSSQYATAGVQANSYPIPGGSVSGNLQVRGNIKQRDSWVATGTVTDGTASVQGQTVSGLHGDFLYSNGIAETSGLSGLWDRGLLNVVGSYNTSNQAGDAIIQGQGVSLGQIDPRLGRGDVIAAVQSGVNAKAARVWLKTPELAAAATGFGPTLNDFRGISWFSGIHPEAWGLPSVGESLQGVALLDQQGGKRRLDYSVSSADGNTLRLLGDAEQTGAGFVPTLWGSLGGPLANIGSTGSLNYSPVVMQGGVYTFHGPEKGREIRPVEPVGQAFLDKVGFVEPSGRATFSVVPDRNNRANFQLAADGIDLSTLGNLFGIPAASSEALPLSLKGILRTGPLKPGESKVELSVYSPWLRLAQVMRGDAPDSPVFSLAGKFASSNYKDWTSVVGLSPRPFQQPSDSKHAVLARGRWSSSDGLDFLVNSRNFPIESLHSLVDDSLVHYLPTGYLATKDLHIWGSPLAPSIAGGISLNGGTIHLDNNFNLPLNQASVQFTSQNREVSLDKLLLQSGDIVVEGSAHRDPNARLTGLLEVKQLPIHLLGISLRDVTGDLNGKVSVRGHGLKIEEMILAAASSKIGIKGSPLELGSVVLGKSLERNEGLSLRFENGAVVVDFPSGYAEALLSRPIPAKDLKQDAIAASTSAGKIGLGGTLRLTSVPRNDFNGWLHSSAGPVFGTATSPFKLYWDQLELSASQQWLAAAGLRSPEDNKDLLDGDSTGELALQGSFSDTALNKGARATGSNQTPLTAQFKLERLNLVNTSSAALLDKVPTEQPVPDTAQVAAPVASGSVVRRLSLTEPLDLTYSQKGAERWLDSKAFRFSLSQGSKDSQPGSFSGEFHIPIQYDTRKGSSKPSIFHLEIEEMPVDTLTDLFPFLGEGSGTIHRLSLDGIGDALRPNLHAQLQLGPSQIGRLSLAKVDGDIYGLPLNKGRYELLFASGSAPNPSVANSTSVPQFDIFLGKGQALGKPGLVESSDEISTMHRFSMKGGLELQWDPRLGAKDTQPFWQRYALSPKSVLDLHAELLDQDARLLSAFFPDTKSSGKLAGALDLTGTLESPQVSGNLGWENGSLASPFLGQPLTDIQINTKFEKITPDLAEHGTTALTEQLAKADAVFSRYTLEKFSGLWGGKAFTGKGKAELVGLEPSYLNLNLNGKELPLSFGDYFHGTGDVDLNLLGQITDIVNSDVDRIQPTLTGSISVEKGDLTIPLSMSSPSKAWTNFWKGNPVRYDVGLRLGDDVWAGLLSSSIRGQGDLRVVPSYDIGSPVLDGDLFLSRGVIRIPLYEVNFRVRQGYAHFRHDLIPTLENVEADSKIGNYQITARFDGKFPNVRTEMVSNPPLADNELQRLVGLDSLQGSSNPGSLSLLNPSQQGQFLANQGVTFLSNLLTGQLTQGIGRLLFLSEVSFDVLPPNEYIVRLAKALDDRDTFLLTFTQVFRTLGSTQNEQQYGLEWRFQPNLLSRISVDNYGQARFWFQGLLKF